MGFSFPLYEPPRILCARGRAGQDAHAALGRRGLLRAAGPKARAWVWERQVKFSLKPFSKGLWGLGAATSRWDVAQRPTEPAGETKPQDLTGVRGRSHRLPLLPKKGDECPLLGIAQKPLPQGLREGNARITPKTQETSHFYDLCRCTNHFQSWKNRVVICTCVQIIEPA